MTDELLALAYTAVLTALLWVPYVVGLVLVNRGIPASSYRDPTPPELPSWVKRCNRAHLNAVESLVPFAAIVLVAHAAGVSNATTALAASVFLYARITHAVVYWLGIPYLRTIVFSVGLIATLVIFYEVVTAMPPA